MPKAPKRDTRLYALKKERRTVYIGITSRPIEERAAEHKQNGKRFTHVKQIGRAQTRDNALANEKRLIQDFSGKGLRNKQHNGK